MTNLNEFKKLKKLKLIKSEVEQILLILNNSRQQFKTYIKYSLVRDLVNEINIKEVLFLKVIQELNENIKNLKNK